MVASRDAGVDPRFDPQFQRGYDPSLHPTRTPRSVPPPAPERVPPSRPTLSDAAAAPDDLGRLDDGVAREEEEPEAPRRNPFRLALLIASIAAIAGAGLLLWRRISDDPYGGYGGYGGDVPQVFFQQLVDALLAPLLTGGLLGLVLWLALGALQKRDRG